MTSNNLARSPYRTQHQPGTEHKWPLRIVSTYTMTTAPRAALAAARVWFDETGVQGVQSSGRLIEALRPSRRCSQRARAPATTYRCHQQGAAHAAFNIVPLFIPGLRVGPQNLALGPLFLEPRLQLSDFY